MGILGSRKRERVTTSGEAGVVQVWRNLEGLLSATALGSFCCSGWRRNTTIDCSSSESATLSVGSSKQNRHPPHPTSGLENRSSTKDEPVMLQAVALSPALDKVRQQQWLALA